MTSVSTARSSTRSAVETSSYFATKCRSSVGGLAGGAVGARGRARGGVLPGGAVGRGLRGSSCTIRVKQSSAAGGVLTGSRCRDGDGAIGSAIGRGDDVPGCRLACSLRSRRSGGVGGDTRRTPGVTERSRARRWGCVCAVRVAHSAVISCGDAFAKRISVSARWCGSGGSSRWALEIPAAHSLLRKVIRGRGSFITGFYARGWTGSGTTESACRCRLHTVRA